VIQKALLLALVALACAVGVRALGHEVAMMMCQTAGVISHNPVVCVERLP
jgi:hypothetical protein